MLGSAFTAKISCYSNEIVLSPTLPVALAPSLGAGKPRHPNIPFVPAKARLDAWLIPGQTSQQRDSKIVVYNQFVVNESS
jgi:hypothetical protein